MAQGAGWSNLSAVDPQTPETPPAPPYSGQPPYGAPPGTPNPSIPTAEISPAKAWYWVAGALGVACLVMGIVGIVRIVDFFSDTETFRSPQVLTVTTDREAKRTIYTDTRSSNINLVVARLDEGRDAVVRRRFSNSTISFDEDNWYVVADVTFPDAGTYEISANPLGAEFALAPRIEDRILSVGGWFAGSGLAFVAGLVIFLVTIIRRRRAKRRLEPQLPQAGQYVQPGQQPQHGQYGQPGQQPQYLKPGQQPQQGYPPPPGPQPQYLKPGQQPQQGYPPPPGHNYTPTDLPTVAPPQPPEGPPRSAPSFPTPPPLRPEPGHPSSPEDETGGSSSFDPFAPPPAPEPANPIENPPDDVGPISRA